MNRTRTSLVRRKLALESLEERWTPAVGTTIHPVWLDGLRAAAITTGGGTATGTGTGTGTLGGAIPGSTTPVATTPSMTTSRFFRTTYLRASSTNPGVGTTTPTTPTTTTPVITRTYFNPSYLRSGRVVPVETLSSTPTVTPSISTVPSVSLGSTSSTSVASTTATTTTPTQATTTVTNSTGVSTNVIATTVPANVSSDLAAVYYHSVDSSNPLPPSLTIVGSNVAVSITGTATGDFNALVTSLRNLGMQIQSSDATYHAVRGMLTISQIPTAAAIPQMLSMSALRKPMHG